jgi:RNA-dependent RNA polymerase
VGDLSKVNSHYQVAHYQVGFLNRQFIMIMSALGVPDKLFIELFEEEVSTIRGLAGRIRDRKQTEKDVNYLGIYTSVS